MSNVADHRQTRATALSGLLATLDESLRRGDVRDLQTLPTGFAVLDDTIGGGVRGGELVLLGGPPGVGKTIASLQMARNMARDGHHVLYICYEHEEAQLATRLLAMETAGTKSQDTQAARDITSLLLAGGRERIGLREALHSNPDIEAAFDRMSAYADHLTIVRASGAHTDLTQIETLIFDIRETTGESPVVFVDYLQKIPVHPEPDSEAEKVTRTVETLKDIALTTHVPIVLISAVNQAGMQARRLRLHHLRGSSAIAFEADVVVMLNEKSKAVANVHLAYDNQGGRRFREWVVFSIEKNRGGPQLVDLEFEKDFTHFRFEPGGQVVSEKLVDERLDDSTQ